MSTLSSLATLAALVLVTAIVIGEARGWFNR